MNFNILSAFIKDHFITNICICLIVLCSFAASAQILDDSTKQVYSTKTTKYLLEEDVLNGNYNVVKTDTSLNIMKPKNSLDTLIEGFHNYSFLFRGKQLSQDLGNYLSPIQDVYFQNPTEIGKQLGFNSFDKYAINTKSIKYYDTKSPYSKVNYTQGTRGQQGIVIDLSRNITPNWNVGIDFRRQTSKKILGSNQGSGATVKALESDDWFFAFSTRYYTKNERYHILANITHGHQVYMNNGGIKPTKKDSIVSENFKNVEAQTYLKTARSIDKRINYHWFQELNLNTAKTVQLYSITDYTRKTVRFNNILATRDNKGFSPDSFFYAVSPAQLYDVNYDYRLDNKALKNKFNYTTLYMADRTDYTLLENQVGIKGTTGKLHYKAHYRRKDFTYRQLSYSRDTIPYSVDSATIGADNTKGVDQKFVENFVGARFKLNLTENAYTLLDAEYMLGRDYRYRIELGNKWFQAGYAKIYHSPNLMQLQNNSNVRNLTWNNYNADGGLKFLNTQTDKLHTQLNYESTNFKIAPGASYEVIRNLVYYDTLARPTQANSTLTFASADLFLALDFWRIHIETYTRYTHQNIDSFWVVPKLYNKNRIYIHTDISDKAAHIQLGIDTYWRSSYTGASYMPVTQQFYNNYNFDLKSFLQIDVFLNLQIKNASVFLKYAYINGGNNSGYFTTPGYTAIPNSFDFGIKWMFFD